MTVLRLILYLFFVIISLISIVSHYSTKGRWKKNTRNIIKNTKSHRKLRSEEAAALSFLYGIQLQEGLPVYRVEGAYEASELEVKGSVTAKISTIGSVLLRWEESLNELLLENNFAEIVDVNSNKGACILTFNDKYSALEESRIRKALESGEVFQKRESSTEEGSFEFRKGRRVSPEELIWLKKDFRVIPVLVIFPLILIAYFMEVFILKLVLISVVVLVTSVFILPGRRLFKNPKNEKDLILLHGSLKMTESVCSIDRFILNFPKEWEEHLVADQKIRVEAYPEDKEGRKLSVLSLNDIYSIRKQEQRQKSFSAHRFFSLIPVIFVLLLILLFSKDVVTGFQDLSTYQSVRSLQQDFTNYKETRDFRFVHGQAVHFQQIPAISAIGESECAFLFDENELKLPDFSPIIDRIDILSRFIALDEMDFLLYVYDYEEISETLKGAQMGDPVLFLEDYVTEFSGNEFFPLVRELITVLDEVVEKDMYLDDLITLASGGALDAYFADNLSMNRVRREENPDGSVSVSYEASDDISVQNLLEAGERIFSDFFKAEADNLNALLFKQYESALAASGVIKIRSSQIPYNSQDTFYYKSFLTSEIQYKLSPEDSNRMETFSTQYARIIVDSLVREPYQILESIDISGLIDRVQEEGDIRELELGWGDYDDINSLIVNALFFLALVLLLLGSGVYLISRRSLHAF